MGSSSRASPAGLSLLVAAASGGASSSAAAAVAPGFVLPDYQLDGAASPAPGFVLPVYQLEAPTASDAGPGLRAADNQLEA